MGDTNELTEVKIGPRTFLRVGEPVKVARSRRERRDGYVGIIRKIFEIDGHVECDVFGGRASVSPALRRLPIERLSRTTATPTHRRPKGGDDAD